MFTLMTALFLLAADCPMHDAHMHAAEVDSRGDQAMGFSHETTKHTFKLQKDGGSIEITANSADDAKSISAIRNHLQTISKVFAIGDFAKPEFIHGQMPDGADVMRERKDSIHYRYEERPAGARVVITTEDAKALSAVHSFLRFQITEHRTGDSLAP
jgi:hypothetical protein